MKRSLPWMIAGLLAVGVVGLIVWRSIEETEREEQAEERREERRGEGEERAEELRQRLREESSELMPDMLGGVALGMSREQVQELREGARPRLDGANDQGLEWLEEQLANRAQVVYGFEPTTDRLVRVQIMSLLPTVEALAPHMTRMIEMYGPPTGAYNCPDTGGVPTRRFTWRRSQTAIADIFLIYGDRISQTLYIAPAETIGASLRRARCTPITREELPEFPIATVEQIMESQEGQLPEGAGGKQKQPVLRATPNAPE